MENTPFQTILASRSAGILLQSPNDYRLYRLKTARTLAKARRDLKIQQKSSGKASSGSSSYKQRSISSEDIANDSRFGNLLLLLAERAWAHAMETKAVLETNASSAKQRRVVSKLAKSAKYAELLNQIVSNNDVVSKSSRLELYCYLSLIQGSLAFEQHQWIKAVKTYSNSRILLLELLVSEPAAMTSETTTSRQLINDIISTTVDPALSFAVYKTGNKRVTDIPTLAKLSADKESSAIKFLIEEVNPNALNVATATNPATLLGQINWRGHSAQVTDPDLASAIISARKLDDKLQNELSSSSTTSRTNLFDEVLQGWQEALDLIKESIDTLESSDRTQIHDQSQQDQYVVLTYINYNLLVRRIQRDRLFVEQLINGKTNEINRKKNKSVSAQLAVYRDVVRIYETILQSVSQLIELPGVHNDDSLSHALNIVSQFFKAQRTSLIAKSYRLIGDKKKESLALFELAVKLVSDSQQSTAELPDGLLSQAELETFFEELKAELIRAHGIASFEEVNSSTQSGFTLDESVANSLDIYPPGQPLEVLNRLVDFDPPLKSIPIKPVFFDIAFNYIQYDDASKNSVLQSSNSVNRPKNNEDLSGTPTKKGFLGGLWGRK